jgi:undecaprenyl-diphosphatase
MAAESAAAPVPARPRRRWLDDLDRVDRSVYAAIASTPTPALDGPMRRLSHAADFSRLSLGAAALLALGGGAHGRRAAVSGIAAVCVTATVVNVAVKPLARRRRPDRTVAAHNSARHVRMPISRSFPSGHAAAAFAFASGVGQIAPAAAVPLYALATLVAYSRVHTGVHYPGDVVAGAALGVGLAHATPSIRSRLATVSGGGSAGAS